jgi:hypothetical protein
VDVGVPARHHAPRRLHAVPPVVEHLGDGAVLLDLDLPDGEVELHRVDVLEIRREPLREQGAIHVVLGIRRAARVEVVGGDEAEDGLRVAPLQRVLVGPEHVVHRAGVPVLADVGPGEEARAARDGGDGHDGELETDGGSHGGGLWPGPGRASTAESTRGARAPPRSARQNGPFPAARRLLDSAA